MTDGTSAITTVHFAAMALFALLAVIGIVAGMRRKRGRVQAQREVEDHAAEAGVVPDVPQPDERPAEQEAPPPPPPSVALQPDTDTSPVVRQPLHEPTSDRPLADEPIAAIAPDGTTAAVAVDPADAQEPVPADGPLTQIKGLGPKVAARLGELGIDRVGQLAALDPAGAQALDVQLGPFSGRMERDRWIEQARLLAAGDRDGFERVFGKL